MTITEENFAVQLTDSTHTHEEWLAVVNFGLTTLLDAPHLLIELIVREAEREASKSANRTTDREEKVMDDKPSYKRHEDDDWIDAIRINTVPRYKTSGLSGDEWRFSAHVQFFRKGVLMFERSFSKLHYAIDFLPAMQHELSDKGFFDRDANDEAVDFDRYCFNPGCKEDGVVEYELIDEYIPRHGIKEEKHSWRGSVRRRFCEAHAMRGDCGLEDADRNYLLISAPPGWKGNADLGARAAESPSAFAGTVGSLDDLPAAIEEAKREHEREIGDSTN